MAHMIPSNTHNMTPGERKLYGIFHDKFPPDCIVRYEVLVGEKGRRPDFTILDPKRGICIAEVKDYGVKNITRLTTDQISVRGMGSSPIPITMVNPNFKCQAYKGELIEMLMGMASLRDEKNRLKIPVEYFLVFPNIKRDEFIANDFAEVIPTERVIFSDDLERNGEMLVRRYEAALPVIPEPMAQPQMQAVTSVLDPTISLPGPITQEGFITVKQRVVAKSTAPIAILSLEQEEIAKSLGEGPRLLRGIAGTGKTIILLYRAKLLAANDPSRKILILCWNVSLANYMRQAYDSFPFEAKGQVEIKHFSEFAHDILSLSFDPLMEDEKSLTLLHERFDLYRVTQANQYNAIYVDEAQDFRKEWIEFLFNKMVIGNEPKEKNFIIAADDAQRIYHRRDFSWENLNFQFTGRSKILKTIYRNSARIWIFSAFLLAEKAAYVQDPARLTFANQGKFEPLVKKCDNLAAQVDYAVQLIKNLLSDGFAARNVLILYRHKKLSRYPLVDTLREKLKQAGVAHDWISKDAGAKRKFDWQADSVKISTVHSAKGMDSPIVIILGVETYQPHQNQESQDVDEVKLLYVAMTRAREFLAVLYSGENGLVPNLLDCESQYAKFRPGILAV